MLDDMLQVSTHLLFPSQTDLCLDRVICDELTHTLILEVTSTQETPRCPRMCSSMFGRACVGGRTVRVGCSANGCRRSPVL